MITDQAELGELQSDWAGVVAMRKRFQLLVTATFAQGAFTAPALAGVVYNLPLLHAFSVLNQTLVALRDEGRFSCHTAHLGPLMDSAKTALPWLDWQGLRDGVRLRNEIAHDGALLSASVCTQHIDLVAQQLRAWNIIDDAV